MIKSPSQVSAVVKFQGAGLHCLLAVHRQARLPNSLRLVLMQRSILCLISVVCLGAVAARAADAPPTFSAEQIEFFEKSVRPVLAENCYSCHGGHRHDGQRPITIVPVMFL